MPPRKHLMGMFLFSPNNHDDCYGFQKAVAAVMVVDHVCNNIMRN